MQQAVIKAGRFACIVGRYRKPVEEQIGDVHLKLFQGRVTLQLCGLHFANEFGLLRNAFTISETKRPFEQHRSIPMYAIIASRPDGVEIFRFENSAEAY